MSYRFPFPEDAFATGPVRYERDGELVVAQSSFFILANIELPLRDRDDSFVWTCWMSLSEASYDRMQTSWDDPERESEEPAFSYVSTPLPTYEPTTSHLKSRVHTRGIGVRPYVELEPTSHPLAVEQRDGMPFDRVVAVHHLYLGRMK